MEFRKIIIDSPDFKEAWQILDSSFPEDEKRDLSQQKEVFKKDNYSFISIYDDTLIGIVTIWHLDGFAFIEQFAVKKEWRNKGYGVKILKELEGKYNKIILEMEFPETELQKRRLSFYQKAGFILNLYPYKQPPYSEDKKSVNCLIMSYPKKISKKKFPNIRKILHKEVYNLVDSLI